MRKEWKERREECSALGIGEREAEEAGARERVIELLSLLPLRLYFTLGLPSCAPPWRKQPKTRRKKRRSEVK